jgi:hypothetical protein
MLTVGADGVMTGFGPPDVNGSPCKVIVPDLATVLPGPVPPAYRVLASIMYAYEDPAVNDPPLGPVATVWTHPPTGISGLLLYSVVFSTVCTGPVAPPVPMYNLQSYRDELPNMRAVYMTSVPATNHGSTGRISLIYANMPMF